MLYAVFKRSYFVVKRLIEAKDQKRMRREVLPKEITHTEYVYLEDGHHLHRFNLYKNLKVKDTKHLPLIIDIHGGGWICGDKDTNNHFNYHLALGGNNVSSLSYRTIDRCTIREQIQDIFAYLHFLEEHADYLGICLNDVSLTGDSAGGQLALLAHCINQDKKLQKLFSVLPVKFSAKCLILNHSVCYINEAGKLPGRPITSRLLCIPGLQRMMYGKKFTQNKLYQNTFSPMRYIHEGSKIPPILLITSKGDKNYSYQTLKLYRDLTAAGRMCELYYEKNANAGHVFNVAYPDSAAGKKCNRHILKYIKDLEK